MAALFRNAIIQAPQELCSWQKIHVWYHVEVPFNSID